MVVAAEEGAGEVGAGLLEAADLLVEQRVATLLSRGRSGVSYLEGTSEAIPLEDASATVVWSIATVHHWHDVDAGLTETRRVLRPGGRFLAVERRTDSGATGLRSHGWAPGQAEAFAEACRAHGFVDVRVDKHRSGRHAALTVLATAPAS